MGSIDIIKSIKSNDVDAKEVKSIWDSFNPKQKYRLFKWRKEIKKLCDNVGLTLAGLAECIGAPVVAFPRVYTHLPKEKETYVLVGLALSQGREKVDHWIIKNTKQNALYAKDEKDLIGIHFLNLSIDNAKYKYDGKELCEMYLSCLNQLKVLKHEFGKEIKKDLKKIDTLLNKIGVLKGQLAELDCKFENTLTSTKRQLIESQLTSLQDELKRFEDNYNYPMGTNDLESKLEKKNDSDIATLLIEYIKRNQRSFQEAYSNPRKLMNEYVDILLTSINSIKRNHETTWTRFTLKEKGYISNGLYNYLMGNIESVQKLKKKSTVISYSIQLGMGLEQINETLKAYGFDELNINDDPDKFAEFSLIPMLICWEEKNESVHKWRDKYVFKRNIELNKLEEKMAVEKILSMRNDLISEFCSNFKGENFPF